jgi:hypothetical protein
MRTVTTLIAGALAAGALLSAGVANTTASPSERTGQVLASRQEKWP